MSVATKRGDDGSTEIGTGRRLSKFSARIEASGSIDELNAYLGIIQTLQLTSQLHPIVERIQNDLFVLGSDLAMPCIGPMTQGTIRVGKEHIDRLEADLETLEKELPALKNFIIPGGSSPAAHLHYARAICRRAERRVALLASQEEVGPHLLPYLNRLSDLFFTMARWLNHRRGISDPIWSPK